MPSHGSLEQACLSIEEELSERVAELNAMGKSLEASRLQTKVINDLMILRETGFCNGAENYSRHFSNKSEGDPPDTLIDYFQLTGNGKWLLIVDESHVTLPQLKAMYKGNSSRKQMLVKHGYRLPSALDHRPLRENEFWNLISQGIFVSATPSRKEIELANHKAVEMIIRPTFIYDPIIEVRPPEGQLDDLLNEIKIRAQNNERTLALALTKRDAEDLAAYLIKRGVQASYIHSGLKLQERSDALKSLQNGSIDCLVGVNLLREGLDLPQVSLVAILRADAEGFLRSETALLQTVGRAARNTNGTAIFYASRVTESMQRCIEATERRRTLQLAYNAEHNRTPVSTKGSTMMSLFDLLIDEIQNEGKVEAYRLNLNSEITQPVISISESSGVSQSSDNSLQVYAELCPSKPGVYFWKDELGKLLYIGKAKNLRSRVKSYLMKSARHCPRIQVMIEKAKSLEFILTPSERDALSLESKLIKQHQPPYNILLKDDTSYPYICASVGDSYPRFSIVPRRHLEDSASKYKYFGPYPRVEDVNKVLDEIEKVYRLRDNSFEARYGSGSNADYLKLFEKVLVDVFEDQGRSNSLGLSSMRQEFEEASLLFENESNFSRDVVAIGTSTFESRDAVVLVLQLRHGILAGKFSYPCTLPDDCSDHRDLASVIESILISHHYPSGEASMAGDFSFFPEEVLLQFPLESVSQLKLVINQSRAKAEPHRQASVKIRNCSKRGPRKESDERALEFAVENAKQSAIEDAMKRYPKVSKSSLDGSASKELATILSLSLPPVRIECYDISHTQGEMAVGSRVVFIDGKPMPNLYRRFNIQTVEGIDDYACLEEVLHRRFHHIWVDNTLQGVDSPWSIPDLVVIDGGLGQLNAAVQGMQKANIFPAPYNYNQEEDIQYRTSIEVNGLSKGRVTVPICALAKKKEELFVLGRKDPLPTAPDSPALLLLRSLRDESHRYALQSHRKHQTRKLLN
jgi:excinuclease UvrABC nuclease subunit